MNHFLMIFALVVTSASTAFAEDYSKQSNEALIGELSSLNVATVGIDSSGEYETFLPDSQLPQFEGGLLPTSEPSVQPQMVEIVRRGASALPELIAHLTDARPTKLQVAGQDFGGLGGQLYTDEYDPRVGVPCSGDACTADDKTNWFIEMPCGDRCRLFEGKYTVKIADVCEVLIGQIVNRRLSAVRYQPTAFVYVNSPIEQPSLVDRIKKDWGDTDAAGLEAALLEDIRIHPKRFINGALTRLRFYYPKTYAGLQGKDLEKRNAFEAEEKAERSRK